MMEPPAWQQRPLAEVIVQLCLEDEKEERNAKIASLIRYASKHDAVISLLRLLLMKNEEGETAGVKAALQNFLEKAPVNIEEAIKELRSYETATFEVKDSEIPVVAASAPSEISTGGVAA